MITEVTRELVEKYVDRILDDLDIKTMSQILRENMLEMYKHTPPPDILVEIEESYPELLVDVE